MTKAAISDILCRPMKSVDLERVLHLKVTEAQLPFVGTTAEMMAGGNEGREYHLIEYLGRVVGIFNVDLHYPQQFEFCPSNCLGLRGLLVDASVQGLGVGSNAIKTFPDYLRSNYGSFDAVYLTVNCKNEIAHHCYDQGGFKDTGELYHGGTAGPQHIMCLSL